MRKAWFVITILLVGLAIIIFVPALAIAILILNALLAACIVTIQLITVLIKPKPVAASGGKNDYFVSIHVPCHNEPFGVVKKTLDSLAELDYRNYEVVVIDNNTHDPKIWHPIRDYCKELGNRFKFVHIENLKGYKAGALNAVLKHIDPRTEIIGIVDADYRVGQDFLKLGVPYFNDPSIAIVQYPQAYYNSSQRTIGLEQEYRSFFDNVLEQANSWDAVTATGTLSLLRAKLFSVGLLTWNEWCITEDTEISMHLHGLGYKGIFINQVLGRGLMPFNYYSLQRQRERWVHGNMQIIRKDLLPTIKNKHINWQQKLSFITQLTTWFHPNLLPIIYLTLALIYASWRGPTWQLTVIGWISLITVLGFILAKAVYFLLGQLRRNNLSFASLMATLTTHFGLTGTMSLTWPWALTAPSLPFNRTTKDPGEKVILYMPIDGILAVILFVGSVTAAILSFNSMKTMAIISAGLASYLLLAVWFLMEETKAAKRIAHKLINFPSED